MMLAIVYSPGRENLIGQYVALSGQPVRHSADDFLRRNRIDLFPSNHSLSETRSCYLNSHQELPPIESSRYSLSTVTATA